MEKYFKDLEKQVRREYGVAEKARKKGLDPCEEVEIPLAKSLAEKSVGLVSSLYPQLAENKKLINRILELEKEYGKLDPTISFKIAEEVAKQKFCKFSSMLEAIEAGIRVGFAYNTLGVVASPIEGFTNLKLKKTKKGEDYFCAYFSGPIRSAGTTATCLVLLIIDYLRELFGYAKYDPTEKEVKRYIIENYDYHERVTNLQYLPTEEEIEFLARNLPIQIDGEPTEKKEVSNYKDLERVETNFIRGGMCLTFSEGLAQKAAKGFRLLNRAKEAGIKSTGWDFLKEYIELHEKREGGESKTGAPVYIKDLVAGRPVLSHPSRSGGFRFRYGRSRVCGFSATSIHPATMGITNSFLSTGTQLKVEKPTKGCAITSCDSIEGPIVKLKNGSVKKLKSYDEAKQLYKETEEIIYLGDILFPLGDVINRNAQLIKPGYVEEWWNLELEEKGGNVDDCFNVDFETAVSLSKIYKVPLYPRYIFYWSQISFEKFKAFLDWLNHASFAGKIILPYNKIEKERFKEGKRALELLGIEHDVTIENVVLSEENSKALLVNLGIEPEILLKKKGFDNEIEKIFNNIKDSDDVLSCINKISNFIIKDKAGTFIGARMGRPEKAKMRKLTGSPNVLFPVGEEGGRMRSVNEAVRVGSVRAEWPIFYCKNCGKETIYRICENCGKECEKMNYCEDCGKNYSGKCPKHGKGKPFSKRRINSEHYFKKAIESLGIKKEEIPELIKGVRGTTSENHDFENLCKGILRAKYNLRVNKDGTIRYDVTELPITHFKPKEIRTSIEKLKELGYEKDIYGKELKNEEQILELKPHDIILPSCPETSDEKADELFFLITKFLDELLEKFYKMEKFYNLENKEDLVGHLVACMAPHNCAGVIGRIIGFSRVQGLLASPYMHAAMRRDCDGDEAAVMMLLDVLLNFSRKFLPSHRGGNQDAPLVLNVKINAGEVDDQILDLVTCKYNLDVYKKAEEGKHSSEIEVETVRERLKKGKNPFINIVFTHGCSDFNLGAVNSSYKFLPTMKEKVEKQMELVEKIRAVDTSDVARLIIDRHFIRDIRGNLRKFSQQEFRCSKCNTKYRRPPLSGNCLNCGGNIIFTISEGSIVKYLEPALSLTEKYDIPDYVKQGLELTKSYIESIFGKEKEKQEGLGKWF